MSAVGPHTHAWKRYPHEDAAVCVHCGVRIEGADVDVYKRTGGVPDASRTALDRDKTRLVADFLSSKEPLP